MLAGAFWIPVLMGSAASAADQPAPLPPAGERDALRLTLARQLADQIRPPVGAVIAYWGTNNDLTKLELDGWELCDGTPVKTSGSPLLGKVKPALVDRFVMGVGANQNPLTQPITGGTNTIPETKQVNTGNVTLTKEQMPKHSHPHWHNVVVSGEGGERALHDHHVESMTSDGGNGNHRYYLAASGSTPNAGRTTTADVSAGEGQAHAHSLPVLPQQDNRPAFVGLCYIVRVK